MANSIMQDYINLSVYKKMSDNKKAFITSAIDLYSKKGIPGTSTNEIAKKANLSKALFFKTFKSKDNLTNIIFEPILNQVLPEYSNEFFYNAFKDNRSVKQILEYIIKDRYKFLIDNNQLFIILISEILVNENLKKKIVKYLNYNYQKNYKKIKSLISNQTNFDIDLIFSSIFSQVVFLFLRNYKFNTPMSIDEQNNKLEQIIEMTIKSVS